MRPHLGAQRRALAGEHRADAALVLGGAPALEQALRLEPVDQPRDVVRLDHQTLAELADAQLAAGALELEQDVVPRERRLSGRREPLLDGAQGERLGAEQIAPGADDRVSLAFHPRVPWRHLARSRIFAFANTVKSVYL